MSDTPEQSLDDMTHHLLRHDIVSFMDEVQNFWRKGWTISSIQKPSDTDPLSCCLKASIVERMVQVWNSPPKNKTDTVPDWCDDVPPYKEGWSVIPETEKHFFEGSPTSEVFAKRNIFAPLDFMFFV